MKEKKKDKNLERRLKKLEEKGIYRDPDGYTYFRVGYTDYRIHSLRYFELKEGILKNMEEKWKYKSPYWKEDQVHASLTWYSKKVGNEPSYIKKEVIWVRGNPILKITDTRPTTYDESIDPMGVYGRPLVKRRRKGILLRDLRTQLEDRHAWISEYARKVIERLFPKKSKA